MTLLLEVLLKASVGTGACNVGDTGGLGRIAPPPFYRQEQAKRQRCSCSKKQRKEELEKGEWTTGLAAQASVSSLKKLEGQAEA
jgi:hypothetical protein